MTARKATGKPSALDCAKFLQNVVSRRSAVQTQYRGWFPDFSSGDLSRVVAFSAQRLTLPYWRCKGVPPFTASESDKETFEAMLRHRLRVVWHRANSGDNPQASVGRLFYETRDFQHITFGVRRGMDGKPDSTKWCVNTLAALKWLERNTHKLRFCAIKNCREFPYFIVSRTNKKYCSSRCQEIAEVERIIERENEKRETRRSPKPSGLSPEGLERIKQGQMKRWARYKAIKKAQKESGERA